MERSLLVLGADYGGLGRTIYDTALRLPDVLSDGYCYDYVEAAGLAPEGESTYVDVRSPAGLTEVGWAGLQDVVYCAGINMPTQWVEPVGYFAGNIVDHLNVNYVGAMIAAKLWMESRTKRMNEGMDAGSFVVLSSNSALLPRSNSSGYCASKAAVSMGIRCLARDMSRAGIPGAMYGYEPCWIEDTNMSSAVKEWLPADAVPHRVPRGRGQDPAHLADMIVRNMVNPLVPDILHGSMLRVDLGDT